MYESVDESLVYKGKNSYVQKRYFDGAYQDYCYTWEDDWSLDGSEQFLQSYVLKESYMVPSPTDLQYDSATGQRSYEYNPAETAAIKEQLLNKRGVEIGFHADESFPDQALEEDGQFLSTKNWAHYTWYPSDANHAVQIVGWDDNYPREDFVETHQPPVDMFPDGQHEGATNGGNGACLVKNSWGSGEEEFPNKGEGKWGVKNEEGVNTGYFWLSYYDQSMRMVEALEFDTANAEEGYFLDEHDFMQVRDVYDSLQEDESKMANVFRAEQCQTVEEVSCQTTHPNTEVTYEVYVLKSNYQNPEDGILAATMHDSYEYGGFHKVKVEPVAPFDESESLFRRISITP